MTDKPWVAVPGTKVFQRNKLRAEAKSSKANVGSLAIADMGASPKMPSSRIGTSPCLTKTRCQWKRLWIVKKLAHGVFCWQPLDELELGALQGVPFAEASQLLAVLGGKAYRAAVGNAMTRPVVRAILEKAMRLV